MFIGLLCFFLLKFRVVKKRVCPNFIRFQIYKAVSKSGTTFRLSDHESKGPGNRPFTDVSFEHLQPPAPLFNSSDFLLFTDKQNVPIMQFGTVDHASGEARSGTIPEFQSEQEKWK